MFFFGPVREYFAYYNLLCKQNHAFAQQGPICAYLRLLFLRTETFAGDRGERCRWSILAMRFLQSKKIFAKPLGRNTSRFSKINAQAGLPCAARPNLRIPALTVFENRCGRGRRGEEMLKLHQSRNLFCAAKEVREQSSCRCKQRAEPMGSIRHGSIQTKTQPFWLCFCLW